MDTLLNWINNGKLDKLQEYILSLKNINSILIYDEDTNLNLLHIISANDSIFRDDALKCLLNEDKKSKNKPKLDINLRSGPGNDCFTACHLAACYGNLSTLEILLDNGANPEILDRNGFNAIDIATAFDQFRCVDLIRRKLKSNNFSINDLNKSCDTIFYSFKDSTLGSFKSIRKIDQQLQTSGQEDLFNNTFSSFNTIDSKLIDDDKTLRNNKLIFSASKVLDKNHKELNARNLNDTYDLTSLNKMAILNSRKKNIKSTSCSKVKNNKSDKKLINNQSDRELLNNQSIESTSTSKTNVIRNLRQNFEQCSINNEYSIDDESIDPFDDAISIRSLAKNKEIYTDNEFNISFIDETKDGLLSSTKIDKSDSEFLNSFNSLNLSNNDENDGCLNSTLKNNQSINDEYYNNLDNNQLYNELIKYNYKPGPITISTRDVYIKKLIELNNLNSNKLKNANKILNSNNRAIIENNKSDNCLMFSKALRSLMKGEFDFKLARQLETDFINIFENDKSLNIQKSRIPIKLNPITPTKSKTSSKQFFNYLLLDPRITQNLCKKASENSEFHYQSNITSINNLNDQFTLGLFKLFIFSIFYIGKGQGNRPYSHLYDAAKFDEDQRQTNSKKKSNINKLNKIKEIWDSNHGVISLHCFHNISSFESLTRECLMIDSIGIEFLTNIQIGQNRIKDLKWTQYKKDVLGTYLLFKAFNILLVNGEREIKRADIND